MHKRIGIIGGLSPESTVDYYTHIFRSYVKRFGDHSYPEIIIYSVNFKQIRDLVDENGWDAVADALIEVGKRLEAAGADFLLLAVNTIHKVYPQIKAGVGMYVLSIMDAVADAIEQAGFITVGLLGTRYTMGEDFYKDALRERGMNVLVPEADEQDYLHTVILDELCNNIVSNDSRIRILEIMDRLAQQGAEAIVLGCTELQLMITEEHTRMPLFDSMALHAEAALNYALEGE